MYPYFYVIEQTNRCNLTCPFCPNHLHQRKTDYMTHDRFKNTIDQLLGAPNIRQTRLALHGCGEPLMNPDFISNLKYLDSHNFTNVDFSTNGMLLNEKFINELLDIRCLTWVRVSLNSSRKELMETLNRGAKFERVVCNIQQLITLTSQSKPFSITVQLMETRQNKDESVEDIYSLFEGRNFGVNKKVLDTFAQQFNEDDLAFTIPGQPNCAFANNSIFIHCDGDLVGCCLDNTKTQVFGNVSEGIFSDTVQRRKQEYRLQLRSRNFTNLPFCKECLK
jgi:pyruvate-formate lyase-activating enzyme